MITNGSQKLQGYKQSNKKKMELHHFEITLQKLYKINVQHYYNSMNEIKSTVSIKHGIFRFLKV